MTKFILAGAVALIALGTGLYFFLNQPDADRNTEDNTERSDLPAATSTLEMEEDDGITVIGTSTAGRAITAYHFGEGETELLFVGGIHGGYSWNTALLAYELMRELENDPGVIPANTRVTVIPVLNPDGLARVVENGEARFAAADVSSDQASRVAGRFNGREVDLNRNFDCEWDQDAIWQSRKVNPGTRAFSEPESQAMRDYVAAKRPAAVVVWYSSAGGVFASSCHDGVLEEAKQLTDAYAKASGYRAYQDFNFYEVTGDMVNWLAKDDIPAISVLLSDHENIEWEKNWKGIEAIFNHYAR